MGFSQGGALSIYTALHTKYKIGGFIPVIGWLPLRLVDPVTKLPSPANKDTPMFQLNGRTDSLVPYFPAATKTSKDLKKVFTNHKFEASIGSHATTFQLKYLEVKKWIHEHTNIGTP